MRRIALAVLAAVILLAAYLLLWPVPIDPVAWDPPPAPELAGPYAPNDALTRGRRLLDGIGRGPEDVAFDAEGRLYTGFEDGRIFRMAPPDGEPELYADTGGRPLGLVFDASGRLLVADARRGLLAVAADGVIEILATQAGGVPFGFTDDLDLAPDGTVCFSDASTKFGYGEDRLDLLEHGGHGRLMAYVPGTGEVRVLLDGLQFANGVAVARDGSFVLVAETGAYRIRRYWLAGPAAGADEVFIDNLPGFPDNINLTEDGRLWVALPSPRVPAVDRLAPHPFLRRVVIRLPEALQPDAIRHGFALEVDAGGRPVRSLQDPSGTVALVTTVMERDGRIYLGSYREASLWEVPLP
jgi:sugar lactone lactonase YvrE